MISRTFRHTCVKARFSPLASRSLSLWGQSSAFPVLSQKKFSNDGKNSSSGRRTFFLPGLLASAAGALALTGFALNADAEEVQTAFSPDEYREFELLMKVPLTHDTALYRFKLPEGHIMGMTVASCIVVGADIGEEDAEGNKKLIERPYTPVSSNLDQGFFDLVIKTYEGGPMSSHFDSLLVGDKVKVKGPYEKIKYERNMKRHIGMIAGGTGITPMLQVIREIVDDPKDDTKISLLYGNVSFNDIILVQSLRLLEHRYPQLSIRFTLDTPPPNWAQSVGFVDKSMVEEFCPPPSEDTLIMVCGPRGMVKAVAGPKGKNYTQGDVGGVLKDLGYTEDMVFKF